MTATETYNAAYATFHATGAHLNAVDNAATYVALGPSYAPNAVAVLVTAGVAPEAAAAAVASV